MKSLLSEEANMGACVCMPRCGCFGISFGDAVLTRNPSHLEMRLDFVSESRSMGHPGRRMDTAPKVLLLVVAGGALEACWIPNHCERTKDT